MIDNRSNETEAAKSGINLNLKPVEDFIFEGVARKIVQVFQIKAAWVTADDNATVVQRLFGPTEGRKYPYITISPSVLQRNADRMHNRRAATRGSIVHVTTDQKRTFDVTFLPTDFVLSLELVTNKYSEAFVFGKEWLIAGVKGHLKFNVEYGRTNFGIGMTLSDSINLPQRQADPSNVTEYKMNTELTVNGYISDATLREQQVADKVNINGVLQETSGAKTTVWSFQRNGFTHQYPDSPAEKQDA